MSAKESNPMPQALILAGGQGERLFPLTRFRPKAAVPFGGTFRIIDFTLSNCLNSGLTNVALLTQHLHQELQSYIWHGWSELWYRSGPRREHLICLPPVSGKRYRGTADAVFQNLPLISRESQHVLILSGDHVYRMNYSRFFRQHVETDADLTIVTVEHALEGATALGVIEVDKDLRVTSFSEKPSQARPLPQHPGTALVSTGIYAFKVKTLVDALNMNCGAGLGYDFGRHVIPSLIGSARVYSYSFRDPASNAPCYWRDIGTIDSYYAASMDMVRPDGPFALNGDAQPSDVIYHPRPDGHSTTSVSGPRAELSAEARLSRAVVFPGVRIEAKAEIESSVLLPGVQVASGARLRRVIVEEGVHIPPGFTAGWDLENDRREHTVTAGGVVVISETPRIVRPELCSENLLARFQRAIA